MVGQIYFLMHYYLHVVNKCFGSFKAFTAQPALKDSEALYHILISCVCLSGACESIPRDLMMKAKITYLCIYFLLVVQKVK